MAVTTDFIEQKLQMIDQQRAPAAGSADRFPIRNENVGR